MAISSGRGDKLSKASIMLKINNRNTQTVS